MGRKREERKREKEKKDRIVCSSRGGQEIGPAGWKSAAVPPM